MKFLFFSLFIVLQLQAQVNNPNRIPWEFNTDLSKKSIDLSEVTVVVNKGAFPVLKNPEFIGKEKAENVFFSKEPALVVHLHGEARAYPFNMLTVHEIVNDQISDTPLLVTYCPLCNSGMVFNRIVKIGDESVKLDFQVSGMLRNSDMIMYDEQTESWWQQLTGESIVGNFTGFSLEIIPSMVLSVEDFFKRFPEGKILSKNTGIRSRYGYNPYVGYDKMDNSPYVGFINPQKLNNRLPHMERVVNFSVNGKHKIYTFTSLAFSKAYHDEFEGHKVVVFYKKGTVSVLDQAKISESKDVGTAVIFKPEVNGEWLTFREKNGYFYDKETKSKWDISGLCLEGKHKGEQLQIAPHGQHLAFAWLSFYPDSEIY